jgi:signal transduction histidine kinase
MSASLGKSAQLRESGPAPGFVDIGDAGAETLGQLVGQMAHDLNNLISTVLISIELAARSQTDSRASRLLESALQSIRQQRDLTTAMARAAQACEQSSPLDLHAEIEAASDAVRAALGNVELELRLDAADPRVRADARFLRAALVHLAANASASMPEGGRFLLATRNVAAPAVALPEGEFVLLQAVDTGSGMSEETCASACDLFYSTHRFAHGLGLAQVRDTVRRAGGSIRLDTAPGKGTIVAIALPLAG